MKRSIRSFIPLICILLLASIVFAQGRPTDFGDYGTGSQALCATPGTHGGAAAGFWNPAAWAAMKEWELSFLWNDRNVRDKHMDNWAIALGGEGIGFSMRRSNARESLTGSPNMEYRQRRIDDYQISVGGGEGSDFWGLAYSWSRGDKDVIRRDHSLALGNIYRPFPFLSIGNAAQIGLNQGDYRGISDIGLRPLRNHQLTLFGDAAYGRKDNPTTMQWGAGIEVQPLNGVRVAGKISKPFADTQDKIYTISLGLTMDNLGFHVAPHYNKDSDRMSTSYMFRLGGQAPSFDGRPLFEKKSKVVSVPMKGRVTYQKARWLDVNRIALRETLDLIEKSKNDPTVGGMLLNLSGMSANHAMIWELREKLADFKTAGKSVYVYTDRADMPDYYFASVADYVIMDPMGNLYLPGYLMGRTYWKGVFEKLGLGVEEWRFFTYKSAFEGFARKDMSAPDKEQRLALIEGIYDTWKNDITSARKITPETLRSLVDSMVVIQPEEALQAGLVDTIASWDDAKDIIKNLTGEDDDPDFVRPREVKDKIFADQTWGTTPKIALVYAIGECDMDTGIRGRATSRMLRNLAKRKDVKAVVLRADSPGGDALPSDLVARQMKQVSEKKPMIVSQGQVAASGGYWISMYGDKIFTTPMTITGSIGVIGGWIWNDGFSKKTGFSSDYVKVGDHADFSFGITLPLLGATIPDRNLTTEEKTRMEKLIRGSYTDFTGKVAAGRNLTTTYVDSVGQGRVWLGPKAIELKLADEIGGMEQAIDYARKEAKLRDGKFEIIEYPQRGWFASDMLMGGSEVGMRFLNRILGKAESYEEIRPSDYELSVLKRISSNPGMALPMVAPEDLPLEDIHFTK